MQRIMANRRQVLRGMGASLLGLLAGGRAIASGPGGGGAPGGGGGAGGRPASPLAGVWQAFIPLVFGGPTFPTQIAFTANGQFTMIMTDPTTGLEHTTLGTWTLGPLSPGGVPVLTLISQQGQIVLQGTFNLLGGGEIVLGTILGQITLVKIA